MYVKPGTMAGEDGYLCRYSDCQWFVFSGGTSDADMEKRKELRELNPWAADSTIGPEEIDLARRRWAEQE